MMNPLSDYRQHMEVQVRALYRLDPAGRLLCVNEAHAPRAPLFFLGRTRHGHVWHFRHDVSSTLEREVDALCREEPMLPQGNTLVAPPHSADAIRQLVGRHWTIESEWRGPAYLFPDSFAAPERGLQIDETNQHLLQGEFADWRADWQQMQPCMVLVEHGKVVALCGSARLSPHAAEAGVETASAFRGRGYASLVVAAWAKAVQQMGRRPLYSTSWGNLASQGVARKLGLIFYGEDWNLQGG